jgi:hypothetical protein
MTAIGDPPYGTLGPVAYYGTGTSTPEPYDDGLNRARASLNKAITDLSERIDTQEISINDLETVSRALENLIEARRKLDDRY